jgi:hypothetical protein
MKRWLKTLLILAVIFLLPTIWLIMSHHYAKTAVDRYKAQLRAAGEKLTVDELLPPSFPPEKNGTKLFLQAYPYLHFEGAIYTNDPPAMRMVANGKAMVGWQQPFIVSAYEDRIITNTWMDIENELKQFSPALDLLHQAAARSELDFGIDYHNDSSGTTRFIKMKVAAMLLSAAIISDLNRAATSSAVTNLHTILALVNQWKNERTMISQLNRYAIIAIAVGDQWEVLQATNITDSQLAVLQHDWESMEFIQPLEHALEMERIRELMDLQNLRTSNSPSTIVDNFYVFSPVGGSSNTTSLSLTNFSHATARKTSDILWRTSWSYRDELLDLQAEQITINAVRQIETNGFFKDALAEKARKIKMLGTTAGTTNWLRRSLDDRLLSWFGEVPGLDAESLERMMSLEAARRIAIAAVALKRYQLRHGTWPADLKTLVPEFLSEVPRDPVDGLPLRYRVNPGGTFTLYSIGDDGVDNGGDASRSAMPAYWLHAHDWVWPQPATPGEIQQFYKNQQQRTSLYKQNG